MADGNRLPANVFSLGGVAGYTDEEKQRALEGVYTYGEVSRRSWDAELRIQCMDDDGIDVSVLYPDADARDPGVPRRRVRGRDVPRVQRLAVEPLRAGTADGSTAPRCSRSRTSRRAPPSCAGSRTFPDIVGGFLRPNPTADWKHFHEEVYDPIWQAASDTEPRARLPPVPRRDAARRGAWACRSGCSACRPSCASRCPTMVGGAIPGLPTDIDNMAFVAGDRQPGRHDDVDHVHDDGRRVRALPRRCASCSSKRTAAGSCRGSSVSTTTPTSSRGTCPGSR